MKCDFHIHSCYSPDAVSKPEQIVAVALEKGIDCLAITDHDEIKGVLEVEKAAFGKPLLIIPGIEIKSRDGDILAFNVREIISKDLSARETILKIKEKGGLAVIAHPYGWPYPFKKNMEDFLDIIDAIEVYNAAFFGIINDKALEFVKKHDIAFTVGSDSHFSQSIGRAYLEIPGDNLTVEQVLQAVKDKKGKVVKEKIGFVQKIAEHAKRKLKNL